jgi:alkylhydroperoxidase/carboxymuconolactone decarboxylase family protein YurZ
MAALFSRMDMHVHTRGSVQCAHLAFYAGWPKAMSAITVTTQVFDA